LVSSNGHRHPLLVLLDENVTIATHVCIKVVVLTAASALLGGIGDGEAGNGAGHVGTLLAIQVIDTMTCDFEDIVADLQSERANVGPVVIHGAANVQVEAQARSKLLAVGQYEVAFAVVVELFSIPLFDVRIAVTARTMLIDHDILEANTQEESHTCEYVASESSHLNR
jgi:hypothetical protein